MANLFNRVLGIDNRRNNLQHRHRRQHQSQQQQQQQQPNEGVHTTESDIDNESDEGDASTHRNNRHILKNSLSDQSLVTLNDLRTRNLLCDAVVKVADAAFNAHRAILSACSSYFRAYFTGFNAVLGLPEYSLISVNKIANKNNNGTVAKNAPTQDETSKVESNKHIVVIDGISGTIMEQLIQYAYLRNCRIADNNVHELLISADYLGIVGLVDQCKNYLGDNLTPENCVSVMGFARFRFLNDLYTKARDYVLRFFIEVAERNQDILEIGIIDFYDIISDDELNIREEDYVWKLCVKWIDQDPDNRKQHVAQLMHGVRLGLMTPKCFMDDVKEHPYVLECEAAKPLLGETFKFMYDLDMMNLSGGEITTPPLAMPRLPHEVIFAIGGWSGGASKGCIETYDTRADRWVNIQAEDPAGPRAYHGTAVIGFKIFSVGGYDGVEYFNTCRVFDAVTKTWKEIAPMHSRRCYVSVAELDGYIYAIGGYDGQNRLNSVERYNPKTNQWTIMAPMNMQRSDASACALRGKIYATGGFNGQECLDSAECYDPKKNVWTGLPAMNHRRSGVSCVAFRDQLYVIGGFNGTARLSTGERFNPDSHNWSFIHEMNHSRSNFGLEIIDDMIFAIGGFNGVSTISHTECYVVEADEWMEATDMNIVRSALTANNVSGLPNKRDYIHKDRDRLMEERRQRLLASANALSVSNASADIQFGGNVDEYQSPDEDEDADDEMEGIAGQLALAAAQQPQVLMPPHLPHPQLPPHQQMQQQQLNEDARREAARRFRVQLRTQRFGSHHEVRRRG